MAEHKRPHPDGVSRDFDPRFSREFQPGFDARVHREAPPSATLRDEVGEARAPARSHDRDSANAGVNSVSEAPMFAVPEFDGTMPGDEAERGASGKESEGDDSYPIAWWRRVNPWFIVLWVVGVLFIVAAFSLIQIVNSLSETGGTNTFDSYFTSVIFQMVWIASPLLMVLGLATLTSTVVIQAARWRRP